MLRVRLTHSFLFTVWLAGCGDGEEAGSAAETCHGTLALDTSGVVVADDCGNQVALSPRVHANGAWREPSGDCTPDTSALECPFSPLGDLRIALDEQRVNETFSANQALTLQGIELAGPGKLAGARAWLSNGFQSWSQSGVIAIADPPTEAELEAALQLRGDGEVVRDGTELSYELTFAGGGPSSLVAGALSAQTFRPWASVYRAPDGLSVRLVSGASGESVELVPGDTVSAETWHVGLGSDLRSELGRWSDALTSRARTTPRPASAGWNSWYDLWDAVDEKAVRENAPLAREVLSPWLPTGTPLRIVIDDGWQKAWGDWEANEKFPSGLAGLVADLEKDGYDTGIWLAPLLVAEGSATHQAHPEWMVEGASYKHGKHGKMFVLDVTHPEAAQHLTSVIQSLVGAGLGLLKIDFLFAGALEGKRYEPVTPMQAYARALGLIRNAAGEQTLLVAVGAPGLASLPFVDGYRVGGDIALETSDVAWAFLPNQARSIASRWALCRATACDADPVLLRKLEEHEVDAGGYIAAFGGGALFLSDDLRTLPAERRAFGLDERRAVWALSKHPGVPEDPYPQEPPERLVNTLVDLVKHQTTHVVPAVWQADDGTRVLLNVSDEPRTIRGVEVPAHSARVP